MEEPGLASENSGIASEFSKTAPVEIAGEQQDDFEFAFSVESDPGAFSDVSADEIFCNGWILPLYPLFKRDLVVGCGIPGVVEEEEEEEDKFELQFEMRDLRLGSESATSSISTAEEDTERHRRAASESIVWVSKSSPESLNLWRKSSSTGSSASGSRKWKLRDLVVGRSRSDGNERLEVIPPSEVKDKKEKKSLRSLYSMAKSSEAGKKEKSRKVKGDAGKEMDIVTAHRIYYSKVASGAGQPAATAAAMCGSRRSFLPYRQELLGGIFGNTKPHLF